MKIWARRIGNGYISMLLNKEKKHKNPLKLPHV